MSAFSGWLCAAVAVAFFGSNFVVVHKYDPGDGMFFQLSLCAGIWVVGLIVFLIRDSPPFYPFALAGGAIWCTGNCCTVFIIKQIGLGAGLITWGTSALLIGWLTGFFGLFGLPSEQLCLQAPWLNVLGFALSLLALADSTMIQKGPPLGIEGCTDSDIGRAPFATLEVGRFSDGGGGGGAGRVVAAVELSGPGESGEPQKQRGLGLIAALLAGCCYGVNFHPSTWIQNHVAGASQNGLDYVFNQFCGIFGASVVYFLIYCFVKQNRPVIKPEIFLPGFVSGVMWAIAQSCWFVANAELGYSAAFPIVLIGPGFLGSMWSVFLFKDIYGMRNYIFLGGYFVIAAAACTCIVLSRKTDGECA